MSTHQSKSVILIMFTNLTSIGKEKKKYVVQTNLLLLALKLLCCSPVVITGNAVHEFQYLYIR